MQEKVVYFGPMGCRTGFYVILTGDLESKDILQLMKDMFKFMADFEGAISGADPKECGNYLDQNLSIAKYESQKFLDEVLNNVKEENLIYPN